MGPGGGGRGVLSPGRESAETGPRPQAGKVHSHSGWARQGPSWSVSEGLAHPAGGRSAPEMPLGWPGEVGSRGLRSVPGLVQTPLQSVVLVRVGEDLVAHPSQQVGRGLGGQDEGLHHGRGQLADHAPHGAGQPLLFVAPRRHLADGLSCVQDALWRPAVSAGVRGGGVGVDVGRLGAGLSLLTSRTVS